MELSKNALAAGEDSCSEPPPKPGKRSLPGRLLAACLLWLTFVGGSASLASPTENESKAIGDAESAAIGWALDYSQDGAQSWVDDLASTSAWQGRGDAAAQIELRAGPAQGATWRLATSSANDSASFHIEFASGLEEVLRLRVVSENGVPRIAEVRAGWEAEPRRGVPEAEAVPALDARRLGDPEVRPLFSPAVPLAVGLAALFALWLAFLKPERRGAFFGLSLFLFGIAVFFFFRPLSAGPSAPPRESKSPQKVAAAEPAETLAWRRRLALGEEALGDLPSGVAAEVSLWAGEEFLAANQLEKAQKALAQAGSLRGSATAKRLQARLASRRGDGSGALLAYQELLRVWPYDEIYLPEAIGVAYGNGFEKQTGAMLEDLGERRSRWPEAQRLMALSAAIDGLPLAGAAALQRSIELGPSRRGEIVADPLGAFLLAYSTELQSSLALSEARAPAVACKSLGGSALADLPGVEATRIGRSLYFELGSLRLEIPGGCALAPAGATSLGAEAWLDRHESALREAASSLSVQIAGNQGRLLPAQRQRFSETVDAFLVDDSFPEIVKLTENLDPAAIEALPDNVRRARVKALHRVGRRKESFDLLVKMVDSDLNQRRSDAGVLFDLGELMVEERQYDLAVRLFGAADRRLPFPVSGDRKIQLSIEKKLIENSLHLDRPPFRLFFSPERDPSFAEGIAKYLLKEQKRLRQWIPAGAKTTTIEVLLLDPKDFSESYGGTGIDLLGLYDGRIRVPLGRVRSLGGLAASILTHELAHALIAEASSDRAPHWLHEGLAQLVEPGRRDVNPLAGMKSRDKWLAFPLVESALSGMASPQLAEQGYTEALWTAIYLQKNHGNPIFAKLLASYQQGAGTNQAFRTHLGTDAEGLNERLVAWGKSGKVPLWETGGLSLE